VSSSENAYSEDFDDLNEVYLNLSEDEQDQDRLDSRELYKNSKISVDEFCTLFSSCVSKMSLSEADTGLLLNFVRAILPIDNNMPDSYYALKKKMNQVSEIKVTKLCSRCESVIEKVFQQRL